MKFIIRASEHRPLGALLEYLEHAVPQCPQQIEVRDYRSKRSLEQNAYYWAAVVTPIMHHLLVHCGRPTSAAIVHEQNKRLFQPVIGSFETALETPGGTLIPYEQTVHKSTTQNSVKEMAEFIEAVIAHWAELGVKFTDTRYP